MKTAAPINFRAFLVVSAEVVCAVLSAYVYALSAVAGCVLGGAVLCSCAAIAVIYIIKVKNKTAKPRKAIAFCLAFALSVCAFSIGIAHATERASADFGGYRFVSGRICAVDTRIAKYRVYLENVRFDGVRANGVICLTINSDGNENIAEFLRCGDELSYDAFVVQTKLVDGFEVNGTSYSSDVRYYTTVQSSDIEVTFGDPNFRESFLGYMQKLMVDNMGEKYGNISFSMLSGDKHFLYVGESEYFSAAGLGHIMAVSGLHIGFLALILNFVLCKLDKRIRFPIVSAVLFAYGALADFSPSVVRAIIMYAVTMLSFYVGGRRDILSSLLCAFSFILAFKPFYLFDPGFVMSFGAIFGIAMFSNSIRRALVKRRVPQRVANAVGAAVSVSVGIAPAQIYFFHKIQVFAIPVNILLLPYISAVFVITVVLLFVASIPGLGAVLVVCKYLFVPIDVTAQVVAAIPFSQITVYSTAAIFLCYPVMFCASEFFMIGKGGFFKLVYSFAVCAAFLCVSFPASDGVVCAVGGGRNTSVLCVDGKTYIVGNMCDEYRLRQALAKLHCRRVDGIYLFSLDGDDAMDIVDLAYSFDIGGVYCSDVKYAPILTANGVEFSDEIDVFTVVDGGSGIGFSYNGEILFCSRDPGTGASAFRIVRTRSARTLRSDCVYLCDYAYEDAENVYTTSDGTYVYSFY